MLLRAHGNNHAKVRQNLRPPRHISTLPKVWVHIAGRERRIMHSCRSLVVREGQVLAGYRRLGTLHQRNFLCSGTTTLSLKAVIRRPSFGVAFL